MVAPQAGCHREGSGTPAGDEPEKCPPADARVSRQPAGTEEGTEELAVPPRLRGAREGDFLEDSYPSLVSQ